MVKPRDRVRPSFPSANARLTGRGPGIGVRGTGIRAAVVDVVYTCVSPRVAGRYALLRQQTSWRQRCEGEEPRRPRERRHDWVGDARTLTARILGS